MKNLENLFAGATILGNTSETVKVSMKNGVATLHSVTEHTSKKGNKCVKLVFRTIAQPDNESQGHEEYISLSEGARFARVIGKIAYLAVHSNKQAAIDSFKALPSPAVVVRNEQGQPLVFLTNDELTQIRESYGEDVTFVWADESKESKERVAIRFTDPSGYIDALIGSLSQFVGEKYKLEVKPSEDGGFQQLVSINKASL